MPGRGLLSFVQIQDQSVQQRPRDSIEVPDVCRELEVPASSVFPFNHGLDILDCQLFRRDETAAPRSKLLIGNATSQAGWLGPMIDGVLSFLRHHYSKKGL